MAPVFWGFRAMFYAALLMFGTVFYATILRFRRKLWASRRFHRFLMWTTPAGILAILGGWVTAETGRRITVADVTPLVERHLAEVLGHRTWRRIDGTGALTAPAPLTAADALGVG